jgi:predicted alpha/beta-hydrolase family hydrolase
MFLGGQSYGGRQASLLAAAEHKLVDGLLLLSYPLHPPGRPAQLRTAHFAETRTSALFVHGTSDPFASSSELESAVKLIPAPTRVIEIDDAGHSLLTKHNRETLPTLVCRVFAEMFRC